MPIRPYRIGFDSTEDFKSKLEQQATTRGFDNYKSYLIALVNRDGDMLADMIKTKSKYTPKAEKATK